MDESNTLIGLFLTAIFIMAALWHIRENTRLESELQKKMDANTAQWLVRFAWSRTLQLLAALGCCIVIFMNYDKAFTENQGNLHTLAAVAARTHRLELANAAVLQKMKIAQQQANKQAAHPAPAPVAAAQPPPPVKPVMTQPVAPPPSPVKKLVMQPLAATPPKMVQAENNDETIEALYDPEKDPADRQSTLDDIKQRYEDIIVIHLFLKKCNKIQSNDFNIINYALSQEMSAAGAPDNLRQDIMTAAKGSYDEVYAKSSCDGKGIVQLNSQYNNYIHILAANFPQG